MRITITGSLNKMPADRSWDQEAEIPFPQVRQCSWSTQAEQHTDIYTAAGKKSCDSHSRAFSTSSITHSRCLKWEEHQQHLLQVLLCVIVQFVSRTQSAKLISSVSSGNTSLTLVHWSTCALCWAASGWGEDEKSHYSLGYTSTAMYVMATEWIWTE